MCCLREGLGSHFGGKEVRGTSGKEVSNSNDISNGLIRRFVEGLPSFCATAGEEHWAETFRARIPRRFLHGSTKCTLRNGKHSVWRSFPSSYHPRYALVRPSCSLHFTRRWGRPLSPALDVGYGTLTYLGDPWGGFRGEWPYECLDYPVCLEVPRSFSETSQVLADSSYPLGAALGRRGAHPMLFTMFMTKFRS